MTVEPLTKEIRWRRFYEFHPVIGELVEQYKGHNIYVSSAEWRYGAKTHSPGIDSVYVFSNGTGRAYVCSTYRTANSWQFYQVNDVYMDLPWHIAIAKEKIDLIIAAYLKEIDS